MQQYTTNKSNKVLEVILSAYLFFQIFCPPIIDISIRTILTTISLLFILMTFILKREIVISREVFKSFSMYVLFFFIFIILQLIQITITTFNRDVIISDTIVILKRFAHVFSIVEVLTILCKYYKLTYEMFMKMLFNSGVIEFIFVITSLLSKSARSFFNQTIIKNSRSDLVAAATSNFSYVRSYGFAENLFDGFGYIIAMIIGFTFLKGIDNKNIKIILFSIVMLVMPLLNTRTGLLLSFVAFIIVMVGYFNFINIIKYFLIFIVVAILGIIAFKQLPESTADWVIKGYNEIISLFSGKGTIGTFNVILDKNLIFPEDILIGTGCKPEAFGINIDSGYVQCIWRFGIVGTFFLFSAFLYYIFYIYKKADNKIKKVSLLIIVATYFIYLFKLLGIINDGANVIVFGVPLVALLDRHYNIEKGETV